MGDNPPIKVMIADDHPIVREGLKAIIDRQPDMTTTCVVDNGLSAVQMFQDKQPDVTLMDLRMPEMDGVTAIDTIRKEFPTARVIVLTVDDGDEGIYQALSAGAKAYLLKETPPDDLVETIRIVHAGQEHFPPAIAAKLAQRISSPNLTDRELEVLQLIVEGKNNKEIGLILSITEGTVKVHVNHILSKLGVRDRTQAVTTALQRGIVRLD